MNQDMGKYIVFIGLGIILIGVAIYFFHDKLHWIGRMPGDIRFEKGNFRFYFPIATMILCSIVLTFIIWLIRRL